MAPDAGPVPLLVLPDAAFARTYVAAMAEFVVEALWWVEAGPEAPEPTYLGGIRIRHHLTDYLREVGGHIGYDVRPSRRREGHATRMLRAALPHAYALGITPALITCDTDNVASRRVIEANGGVLEDQRGEKLRFWVPTGPVA